MFVILSVLQGRPTLIHNEDDEVAVFATREEALEVTTRPLMWAQHAEAIMIIDCDACEVADSL